MMGPLSRRRFLEIMAVGGIGGLSGCASLGSDSPPSTTDPPKLSLVESGQVASTDPRQFKYDARNTCITGTSPPKDGGLDWKVRRDELNLHEQGIDGLAALDDHLIVTSKKGIHSLDPDDGDERWHTDPGYDGATPTISPALDTETAYVAWEQNDQGGISALDLTDGSERWRSEPVARVESNPTLAQGTIYAYVSEKGEGGAIAAFDTTDGSIEWRFPVKSMSPAPAVVDGTVYVAGGVGGTVYALEAATGEPLWETAISKEVTPNPGETRANSDEGSPAWVTLPPTVVDGTIYVPSSYESRLYAFDAADGTEQWHINMSNMGVRASVAATAESVYVPTLHGVTVLAPDGTERWTYSFDEKNSLYQAPVVADQSLLVSGNSAVCLDLEDGTTHWEQTVEEGWVGDEVKAAIACVPVVTDDGVYFGTAAGDIYAIGQ